MKRTLIRGAAIITMDAQGDLAQGDILVTGDVITEIAPTLHVDDAQVVDATGCIIIPGLINAHMHTWQTALRGLAANWTLLEYFRRMHAGLATVFEPEDLRIATEMGALTSSTAAPRHWPTGATTTPRPNTTTRRLTACSPRGSAPRSFMARPSPTPSPGRCLSGKCRIRAPRPSGC